MASMLPVLGTWWFGNGRRDGDGAYINANSSTTPYDQHAIPVLQKKFRFTLNYTSGDENRLVFRASRLNAKKENIFQELIETKRLPAGTKRTINLDIVLPDSQYPLWLPSIQVPSTGHDILIHSLEVYPTPPEGIEFVSRAVGEGMGGSMPDLMAPSQWGDLAVVFYASQFGNTAARPPAGWVVAMQNNAGGRSGYVAIKKVTTPQDTLGVQFGGTVASGARERALMIIIRGVKDFDIHTWQAGLPEIDPKRLGLVAGQYHGNKSTPLTDWRTTKNKWNAGTNSTTDSWSALLVGETEKITGIPNATAWAWVYLTPMIDAAAQEEANPTVEIVGAERGVVTVFEADDSETPAHMRAVPKGYKDIGTMMITKGFLVAHRGGSVSWPEASIRAYTNSVMFGAGALEVSCQCSKDGIWFLNHDRTLQRTDPTAPNTPVTEMTWDEIRKFKTVGEPIMKVEDYFRAYGSSHITVLDPKYSAGKWQELKQFFPSDAKNRIIWKFSVDATWLVNQWKADGWKCWGYSYPEHVADGRLNGWAAPWDYLGMSFEADQATWTKTLALGKPVWAHICATRDQYNQAMQKGAAGCMVSGVANILTESLV
jgi:hypothetical protein